MASRPYFDKSRGAWYCKWKSGVGKYTKSRLCQHPGWKEGDAPPKRPPADAVREARAFEDREAEVKAGLADSSSLGATVAAFLGGYTLVASAGQTAGSMRGLRRVVGQFIAWCDDRKIATVGQVTADVCRKYLAERTNGGASYATVKLDRAVLSPAWSLAFQDGRVAENPWKRAPVPGKPRKERPPFWTESEIERLAKACRPWLADIVTAGAYTGLRITALLGLTWDDIDFAAGTVHVRAVNSKSGKAYDAPMLGPARDVFERRRFVSGDNPLVFHGSRFGRRISPGLTWRKIKLAVQESGVPDHGHFCHCLRHSFATNCISKGVPLATVSRWMGHSSIAMTMIYVHHDTTESKRWAEFFDSTAKPDQEA